MLRALLAMMTMIALSLSCTRAYAIFRCDGRQVIGFSKMDLLSTCGEPAYRDSYTRSSGDGEAGQPGGISCETVDQWYYIDPETHYNYELDIERGYVTRVNRGEVNGDAAR